MKWLMNAAGWAKTLEQVQVLARVPTLTHIVMGSFTLEPRDGNMGGTNFDVAQDGTAVNSLGLRNGGLPYLERYGRDMVEAAKAAGKVPVISVAAFSPSEYGTMASEVQRFGAIAELNVGCPNVHDGGKQKEIISYNWMDFQRVLEIVCVEKATGPVWVKPSPYSNPLDCTRFVRLMSRFDSAGIHAVVGANTFPNVSMYHEDGTPLLHVADNYAGMSGTALKWINLSQCRYYASQLPVPIIGAGGIGSATRPDGTSTAAQDLLDYGRIGCTGGQIGAAFFKNENPRIFEEAAEAFAEAA